MTSYNCGETHHHYETFRREARANILYIFKKYNLHEGRIIRYMFLLCLVKERKYQNLSHAFPILYATMHL